MLMLEPMPQIISFDCYGTLVQWHRTMRDVAHSLLLAHHVLDVSEASVALLADDIRAKALEHQQHSPYRSYATVLRSSLDLALAAIGHTSSADDRRMLWSALSRIAPHADAPSALARLRTRYRLAIISNTDDDLIAGTVAALGAPIDFVVTAQQAKAYKPDHRLFEYAHAKMNVTKDEVIHVGMGQFTDLKVCHEMGIRSVWIDREGEPLNTDWPPDASLQNLVTLPELLFGS